MTLFQKDLRPAELLGEDTWELLQAIEGSFDIELGDYSSLMEITVRELADRIAAKAKYPAPERCLSAVAFYRLRRALMDLVGTPRAAVKPNAPIHKMLPWASRREKWAQVQSQLELGLPKLRYPGWLFATSTLLPVGAFISTLAFFGFR